MAIVCDALRYWKQRKPLNLNLTITLSLTLTLTHAAARRAAQP